MVIDPIEIPPFSPDFDGLAELVRQWESGSARAVDELDNATPAMGEAEDGARHVADNAPGVRTERNNTTRARDAADPGQEQNHANNAAANQANVDGRIQNAEANSFDPRSETPPPGFGAAHDDIQPKTLEIKQSGRSVERQRDEADDFEERAI